MGAEPLPKVGVGLATSTGGLGTDDDHTHRRLIFSYHLLCIIILNFSRLAYICFVGEFRNWYPKRVYFRGPWVHFDRRE